MEAANILRETLRMKAVLAVFVSFALLVPSAAHAEQIGRIGVDWIGNDIVIDAVDDPEIDGVTCHVAYFDRSVIDRLQQGNWFEDPSYSAIDCSATGPLTIGDVGLGEKGEEIFREGRSLIWKSLIVTRIYDADANALVYLAHARELQQGSGKMSLSVVPLEGREVTWAQGDPRARQ